jgi:hypothetical protein
MAFTAAPLRVVELRTSSITQRSVHQHVHHTSHSRTVFSPTHSSVSFSTTHVTAPHTGVTERILVKRMLEARPLGAANRTTTPVPLAMQQTTPRPASSGSHRSAAPRAIHKGRGQGMSSTRLHGIRTTEAQHVTTNLTRRETTHVARTTQVRDTRWRHATDAMPLEWRRKAPQSPPRQEDSVAVMARSAAPGGSARTPAESAASTPAPETHAARRDHTAPALTMDRSTLERLADNVMQRIERRVRIERERRGL